MDTCTTGGKTVINPSGINKAEVVGVREGVLDSGGLTRGEVAVWAFRLWAEVRFS